MWGASEEPSGTMESSPPEAVAHTKETCEQNKNQLESLKEIMIRNQQSLKKKEEEVQEYARRLSKIKSRAKLSRRSKEGASSSKDTAHKSESQTKNVPEEVIDDISQAKTPKAKSSLLQRKLAENRKAFEQRSRELTETKRAVEEKVEAIRQKLDETDLAAADQLAATPIRPLMITSDMMASVQAQDLQEKDKKIKELNSKVLELEATILDLQENIKEKDSVIDSKTKAVTLMSADLSKKGKTTLDTLEDTKDEMRTMQENFVLIETSLKTKNTSLLEQLQERDNRISELEHTITRIEDQLKEQKIAETASADFSRSTMDTLAETKDAMKSMQETFVLIESSLKMKNDNLLQQLEDYEMKLAEARNRIFQLESGAGIAASPTVEDLQFKIEKLEQNNRQLLDEKYELQKNVAELQDKIIATKSVHGNDAIIEKDNRIAELENLIEELKHSNELLKEESKAELQKQITDLSSKNEEYSNRITDLENQVHEIETERNDIAARLSAEQTAPKEDDVVQRLTKELEDLNKNMIKLKAQHKSKVKNLQKQLDNFKMVSDTNAELVRLDNQVALLEEEKGNLQLSLVDFDELKASAGDWQERIADLESKVASQTKDIQMHIEAIAILENQKLDLTQELHTVKQEVSALEAENAESENLRVTAEMKVVELEEQLEAMQQSKESRDNKLEFLSESEYNELLKKLDALTQENSELYNKLSKLEEKGASDTGSTESFEAIHVNDRNDLLKKIEDLEQKNNELTLKLTKEKDGSHAGSTESFETINDTDRHEMLKKIEQLTQENSDLTIKLSRIEEKGSSDTGSTESFERIPEHNDNTTKIELLTQENNELVVKLTKLEEQLSQMESNVPLDVCKIDNLNQLKDDLRSQIDTLAQEKHNLMAEISNLQTQVTDLAEKNSRLQDRVEELTTENEELATNHTKLMKERLDAELLQSVQVIASNDQINILRERIQVLEKELDQMQEAAIEQSVNVTSCETDDAKSIVRTLEREKYQLRGKIEQLEQYNDLQREELVKLGKENESMLERLKRLDCDDFHKERMELIKKLEDLCKEKDNVARERQELQDQISTLLRKSSEEISEKRKAKETVSQETQTVIVESLEEELENSKLLIAEYKNQIEEMNLKLQSMETELQEKTKQALEFEKSTEKLEALERELKDMFATAEEWKFKYEDMQVKMQALEQGKASIEETFKTLENDNKELLETVKAKDRVAFTLQEQLQDVTNSFETKLQNEITNVTTKESEIAELKAELEKKNQELYNKYVQLQNGMIAIDNLQEELNNCSIKLKENDAAMSSLLAEITRLQNTTQEKDNEVHDLKSNISQITEALHQSKPLTEFNEIVENLRVKETNYIELQNKYEEIVKENNELRQKIEDVENELIKKEETIDSLLVAKKNLDAQIENLKSNETEAEKRIWELQVILDNQTAYAKELRSELADEYKQMEGLKKQHIEEITMLNRRLQDVIEELVEKTQENEAMKINLKQEEKPVENIFTEEMKIKLENKIAELEVTLAESENKLQVQSDKMKKIVATFNKKKAACQELEARVAELEEKWTTEKDEKEVKNKQVQEVENSMREKDNKIADLEGKLVQAQNDTAEALTSSDKFSNECSSLKEKITILTEQNAEMGEEIERQRAEIERVIDELARKETAREDIAREYELYKQTTNKEIEQKQAILEEIKEEARELRVRMQVMETEYVEQLATIKNLMAENGLLSSKQAQIDEKLENAEKESEKRRVVIEQLQKELAIMTTAATGQPSESKEDDVTQHCDHSEQCQNLVQALEARLQERQAEIENLNNELANSYGNIVLLHDQSQRYNNMMIQTAQERFNQSLMDQTNSLQQEIDSLKTEKAASEQRIAELESELEEYKRKNVESKVEVPETAETSTQSDEKLQEQDVADTSVASDVDISDKKEIERLESLLNETEFRCFEHVKEIDILHKNLDEERSRGNKLQEQFEDLQNELKRKEHILSEKNTQVESLIVELDRMSFEIGELIKTQEQYHTARAELENFQQLIDERNAQIDWLSAQLHRSSFDLNELTELREQYRVASAESEKMQQLLNEKNEQIDSLIADHQNVIQQMSAQMQQQANVEAHLRKEISSRDIDIDVISAELASAKETVKALTEERDQLSRILESSSWIDDLKSKTQNVDDIDVIRELQQHVSAITKERDMLQLQLNDLTRTLKESEIRIKTQQYLQVDLQNALHEKDRRQRDMIRFLQQFQHAPVPSQELKVSETSSENQMTAQQISEYINAAMEEMNQPKYVQATQASVEKKVQDAQLDIGSGWDNDPSEKVNDDEDSCGWNTEEIQLSGDEHLISGTELKLRIQVEKLQDEIRDLVAQNEKLVEENKAAQIKSAKLIKKVKEYKVQIESLQQELKTQKQANNSFFNLDTAIEEELKAQIANLEKSLNEIKEEKKNIVAEKEALLKRLDVLVSANDRYMEMKEKQDMEVEVLRIQNKELNNKVQSLEWQLQENATISETTSTLQHEDQVELSGEVGNQVDQHGQPRKRSVESADNFEAMSKKYKEEIDDLKDELEALAAENEQLQHYLEEQRTTITNLESNKADNTELIEKVNTLKNQVAQLQTDLDKSKKEYDVLRKQYEQSLIDAHDEVTTMRHINDVLKTESKETIDELQAKMENLQEALRDKEDLENKIKSLMNSEEKLSTVNTSLIEVTELLNARVQEVADLKQELQIQYVERQQAEATLQSEIQNLTRELDEKKQELGVLRQLISDKEHELVQQKNVETVNAIVTEATQELVQKHAIEIEERNKEIHDLTQKLTALQLTVDEYTETLKASTSQLETQQEQIAYLKEDLTERNSIIGSTQDGINSINEKLREKEQELTLYKEEKIKLTAEMDKFLADLQRLQSKLSEVEATTIDIEEHNARISKMEQEIQVLKSEKESILLEYDKETKTYQVYLENDKEEIAALKRDLQEKTEQLHLVNSQLCAKKNELEQIETAMSNKDSLLDVANQKLNEKRVELEMLRNEQSFQTTDNLSSVSKIDKDDDANLQSTIDELKAQMEAKQQELEHLKYILSESTYPTIIQQMQDRINCLYNEKITLESTLQATTQTLTEKQEQVNLLTQCIHGQSHEHISKEEMGSLSRDRRSVHDQEEIGRLQNEVHAKEQEINELKYIIAEKDSQLSLQATMEPQSDDFELRETIQRLTGELYGKEQDVQGLKSTIAELEEEVLRLKNFERLSEESRNAIERLTSEKEQIRVEAEEFLRKELHTKELEIGEIKQKLSEENKKLMSELQLRDNDIENLKTQLEQLRVVATERGDKLQKKEDELMHVFDDLAEKERRLAELSITKDAELHNLKMQIREKDARVEELVTLSMEEAKRADELRQTLTAQEEEINKLKELLEQKVSEYEMIQHALKKDVSVIEAAIPKSDSETAETAGDNKETVSSQLDFALYMLHQRDVRCEELTHELMQLLEERDTLQLRLSNAIRINEELRKEIGNIEESPAKDSSSASQALLEPVVEQPSPSKSEGPVEIAKEAISAPLEDKEALSVKLSQLHSVSHSKDVRLKDERELRHTQQMSLLAHRDVLSTLPPEAAARLVNANYTLSRDVQSQSSVLLNWLWGKSTPKVVHM
ncbi:protein lava lamp-like isoform X2 [Pseudomyrmex gracilis]|nr:protein lava lamp-like isoform X2 [Pseudomyrmex gracilis]